MRKIYLVFLCVSMSGVVCNAETLCEKLKSDIVNETKYIGYLKYEGFFDNSAPRESNRLQKIANSYSRVNSTLMIMQMNKCTMDSGIDSEKYNKESLDCSKAIFSNPRGEDTKKLCDRNLWVGKSAE